MKTLDFNKLVENAQKAEPKAKKEYKADERYFTVKVNKDGVMPGVIRFLAPKEEDNTFFVSIWNHSFKVGNRKFFTLCPTTLGDNEKKCPVCEYNKEHWNEYSKQEQMDRKRKLKYVSNIYVVTDPGNPEREGKVFLWAYGITIYKKIMNMIAPKNDIPGAKPKKPYNIFDEKSGKDFELMVGLKDGNNNYDDSVFSTDPSELCDGDEAKIKEVKKSVYSLVDALKTETDKMKPYEEIKKWLDITITGVKPSQSNSKVESKVNDEEVWPTESKTTEKSSSTVQPLELKKDIKEPTKEASSEDDFFNFET